MRLSTTLSTRALAGHATRIDVTINSDNSITVVDDGRGIPVDNKTLPTGETMPAVQVVLTMLHAGGKFDASNYKVSGGLHGVGVSCVNALSQELDVEIWRDGSTWTMDYSKGDPVSELRKLGATKRRGTKVHFLPDRSIFTVTEYNFDTLANRLRQLAFLNKGIEITLTDERALDAKGEAKSQTLQVHRRHRRIHQATEQGQAGAAREADLHGSRGRQPGDGDRAAVQRCVLGDGVQLYEQHSIPWTGEPIFRASAQR